MKKNDNILLYMHRREARDGITRVGVNGVLGKTAKIFFIIAFIYTFAVNSLYCISLRLNAANTLDRIGEGNLSSLQTEQLAGVQNSIVTVCILSVILTAGLITLLLLRFLPSLIINTATPVILALHFAQRMSDTLQANGLLSSYSYRHLIPLSVLLICGVIYSVLGIRFTASENRAYRHFVDSLYDRVSSDFEKLDDAQWEEFLSSYEPPKPEKLKRSLKSKKRKNEKLISKSNGEETL